MKNFTFEAEEMRELKIKIRGVEYSTYPYTLKYLDAAEKFVSISEELIEANKKAKTEGERAQVVVKTCRLVKETVNSILGKNAYNKIFNNMTVNLKQHTELVTYIFQEVLEFKKQYEYDKSLN